MSRKIIASLVCCLLLVSSTASGQINLFENRNFAGWQFHAPDEGVAVGDVFTFTQDGRLVATGLPYSYLLTRETFKNFIFSLEWRWIDEPTNSGIFIKATELPADCFLPKSVEVQLRHTDAGDLWAFHGREIADTDGRLHTVPESAIGRYMGVRKLRGAELTPGQWNKMEIISIDRTLVITVNGMIVNWTSGAEAIEGYIGFQSEGSPIEFRNAVVTRLP